MTDRRVKGTIRVANGTLLVEASGSIVHLSELLEPFDGERVEMAACGDATEGRVLFALVIEGRGEAGQATAIHD